VGVTLKNAHPHIAELPIRRKVMAKILPESIGKMIQEFHEAMDRETPGGNQEALAIASDIIETIEGLYK
jgi:hypothetical protein